jgi:hypothetical protein
LEELILDVPSEEKAMQIQCDKWRPPIGDALKINSDGTVDLARGVAGAEPC